MSCKTINIDLTNVPPVPIQIGVAGENSFRTITFDASKWGADYPDATYTVVYRRSDGYLYPVLVNASADAIVWNPTGTDTAVSGNGQLEVRLLDGETIGKTIITQTYVAPSLSGDESEPSTPAPDWVNDVADDADRAEGAVSHYPKIVNGVWYVWNAETGEFVSTGISAQGEDGVSPTVTVTAIKGGHRVTITDADGAHTFDVMDGEGGSGSGAVDSVNGKTGAVVLDASDVGALPSSYTPPVESVNGKTGAVVLDAEDVGALPDDTVIPVVPQMATQTDMSDWTSGKTVDAVTLRTDFIQAMTLLGGKASQTQVDTLASVLDDLQAAVSQKADSTDIPTKTSDLTNDSGYQTAQDVSIAILAADPPLEPIRTYTCDGTETTTGAFYITEDDDGNPFRLKKLVMRVTLGTVSASGTFSANILNGTGKILAQAYANYNGSASGYKFVLREEQDSGYWTMNQCVFTSAVANRSMTLDYEYKDRVVDYPFIDRVRLTRVVPAGTVIELFGVPYDSNGIQPAEANSFGGGA